MKPSSSGTPGPASALWATVREDRLVQAAMLVFAVAAALYLLPILSGDQRTTLSRAAGPCVLLGLAVTALRRDLDRVQAEERRFWKDVSAAFAAWLAVAFVYLVLPDDRHPARDLVAGALHAAYYVAFVLAVERQPHRVQKWRATRLDRALAWPAVTAFVLGLFGYFAVIPAVVDPGGPDGAGASYFLYLTLDAYLTVRFLFFAAAARAPRWRLLYGVLAVTSALVLAGDSLEAFAYVDGTLRWGTALDLVYFLPFVTVTLARVRHFPFPRAAERDEEIPVIPFSGPAARTMVYALVFPLVHFGCHLSGLLSAPAKAAREGLVFAVLLLLAAVAAVQQRLWARKVRELWLEREEVETSLLKSEKDLRLMVERYHADRQLRTAEEKFAKALRVSSDVMAISSLTDGRIADVNESFERVTGHRREDVLGKTVADIDLWAYPEERQILVQMVERQGFVRNMEAKFRTRDGGLVDGLVSAEKLTVDGEPYLLSVTHVLSVDERGEAERDGADPAAAEDLAAS